MRTVRLDHERVVCGGYDDFGIREYGLYDRELRQMYLGHRDAVNCIQFDHDRLVSCSADTTVRVWDMKTGQISGLLIDHTKPVNWIHYSGNVLFSCSKDRTIRLWDLRTYKQQAILGQEPTSKHTDDIMMLQYDRERRQMMSASMDGTVKVWDTRTGNVVSTVNHPAGVRALRFDADHLVTAAVDNIVRIYSMYSVDMDPPPLHSILETARTHTIDMDGMFLVEIDIF